MTDLKQWHKAVCSRDSYRCVTCKRDYSSEYYFQNDINQYVCGHHIKSRKAHPELTFEVTNGICVCLDCHNKIHKGLMDIPKNETEQDEEILNESLGELKEVKKLTLPSGLTVTLSHHQKICKCKKYIALNEMCMNCEKRHSPDMKKTKKK